MSDIEFRTSYGVHHRHVKEFPDKSAAKQSMRDECDINRLMAKYQKTGVLDHVSGSGPRYLDLADAVEYHEAMNIVIEADEAFSALPSSLRNRFHNDPSEFLSFVTDPSSFDELVKLGLVEPSEASSEAAVRPVDPSLADPLLEPAAGAEQAD